MRRHEHPERPRAPRVWPRPLLALLLLLAAGAAMTLWQTRGASTAQAATQAELHPQTTWAACNRNAGSAQPSTFSPLSDAAAAALVTHEPEVRPDNARAYSIGASSYPAPNFFVPSAAQVSAFRQAKDPAGQTNVQFNPYYAFVDGRDGLSHPSTDDLIQWAAHKWGIPEDWLRAEYVYESYWNQYMMGDETQVSSSWYGRYPSQSRVPNSSQVYQSLGITQVRWAPDGSLHAGTEPLRWLSTSFNIDYQAATLRFYYDDPQGTRKAWNDASYRPCQQWNSIGAWYRPYPWGNSGQAGYAQAVQRILNQRTWTQSSFIHWSPSTLPYGLHLK